MCASCYRAVWANPSVVRFFKSNSTSHKPIGAFVAASAHLLFREAAISLNARISRSWKAAVRICFIFLTGVCMAAAACTFPADKAIVVTDFVLKMDAFMWTCAVSSAPYALMGTCAVSSAPYAFMWTCTVSSAPYPFMGTCAVSSAPYALWGLAQLVLLPTPSWGLAQFFLLPVQLVLLLRN